MIIIIKKFRDTFFCCIFVFVNYLLRILGTITLVLGVVGIFVPLLPTTPFLLLSAALWVKSSPRLYEWLLNHKYLGPYIRNFRESKAIPLRVKIISVSLVWITIGWCVIAVVDKWLFVQVALLLLALAISVHILKFKTLKKQ